MPNILVTGGAGFIGTHLCDSLLKRGDQVICVDNLATGSEQNISDLKANPNFRFINQDVVDVMPADLKIDQIYHLASPASPNEKSAKSYHALSFETMLVNSMGTWALADLAITQNAKFLYASTSEVYGDPLEHPQKETYNGNVSTTGPRSVYDEAKRFGETITANFVRNKKLAGVIVRIFNTYGPKMALDDGRVVMELAVNALKSQPLPIFGDGKQTRSFTFVSDLVAGLIAAMDKGQSGEVYNLGNPQEFTILDLAQKIKLLTSSNSQIQFFSLPKDDPTKRKPDITKANQQLSWQPTVNLDQGLPLFLNYVREKISQV